MNVRIHNSANPIGEEDIAQAEARIQHQFPQPYRAFLLRHNGGQPEPEHFMIRDAAGTVLNIGSVNVFFGIRTGNRNSDIEQKLAVFKGRVPRTMIPIANDAAGNLICICTVGVDAGSIYFWDHEGEADEGDEPTYDNLYPIDSSFEAFLASLHRPVSAT